MTQGTKSQTHRLDDAERLAADLVGLLEPHCVRIVVAGSVRRRKLRVHDVELLYEPIIEQELDMLGDLINTRDLMDPALTQLLEAGTLSPRGAYGPKNKYLRHTETEIALDVFSSGPENWGMTTVIRTGSREFNIAIMSRFKKMGHEGHAYGGVTLFAADPERRQEVECPDEQAVFDLLGLPYIEPQDRSDVGWFRALVHREGGRRNE